jgi:energy-coupling factor transporter ATP-binding protein EcfA2
MGFSSAQLSTPVKDLSGGQQRRLQLLLILLDQPNVLILDEPTNDLDTDMLAAIEDLLDSWAGTLLVVSHDRYFLERVTDQQYAVLAGSDGVGRLRHLPEGSTSTFACARTRARPGGVVRRWPRPARPRCRHRAPRSGAEARAAQKELQAAERRIEKLTSQVDSARTALADHDQSDYVGLGEKMRQISELEAEIAQLEERWFELTDQLG